MLKVIIHWIYYKDNHWYSSWNARQKKECVYFYDYDDCIWYIINSMSYSELQKFRLNIYNGFHKSIKFTKFWEVDRNWDRFEWLKLDSDIIDIDNSDCAKLLPNSDLRKKFFEWDSVREKYYLKSNFINYVKFNYVV